METRCSDRGFMSLCHEQYPRDKGDDRLLTESSIVGDYDDALDRPGTSALWVGRDWHLNREQVAELIDRLQGWLDGKRLEGTRATAQS